MVGLNKTPLQPLKITHYLSKSELTNIKRFLNLAPSTSDTMTVKSLAKSIGRNKISKLY
jgi:hypothetical protein